VCSGEPRGNGEKGDKLVRPSPNGREKDKGGVKTSVCRKNSGGHWSAMGGVMPGAKHAQPKTKEKEATKNVQGLPNKINAGEKPAVGGSALTLAAA